MADPSASSVNRGPALYAQFCSSCHGLSLQGGLGPSLLGKTLAHGDSDAQLAENIHGGFPAKGMPAWRNTLSDADIQSLVEFLQRKRHAHEVAGDHPAEFKPLPVDPLKSELQTFKLEPVTDDIEWPWAMAFLPNGDLLVTERRRGLRLLPKAQTRLTDAGTPIIDAKLTDGYRGIAVHPNGWVYLAYVEPRGRNDKDEPQGMLRVTRGHLKDRQWTDEQTLWTAPPGISGHGEVWGSNAGRLALDGKGYLYFSIGEWGDMDREQEQTKPQDLSRPEGKIHRIFDDGRIPKDNPFIHTPKALPSIWTYGHRVPQGLAFDSQTGALWSTEHGPKGGDELNLIRRGRNYGWPLITYGINYTDEPISNMTTAPRMEQPIYYWLPSIAITAIAFYQGEAFPKWRHSLFIGSLKEQTLFRAAIEGERVMHVEPLFKDLGRVRDVATGPDGFLYVLFEESDHIKGRIVRLIPAK